MDSKIPNIRFKGFTDAWEQRRLGEVTIYQNGKGYEDSQSSSGKFELINLNSISIDGGLKSSGKYIESADKTLLTDDLVMVLSDVGKGDLLGRVAIIPKDNYYVLNQRVALIRPKNKQQTNYLFSYINSHQRYFKLHGAGMSQLNISKGSVENFPLLLPSLPEQQQIGTFFAHLDTLISLHQRKCDQTKELKKTMLQKMFPKKGETVPEIRFPEFTDAWEQRKLGEIAEFNPKSDLPDEFEYVDLESVVGTEMVFHRTENKASAPSRAQRVAKTGDVFFQTVRPYQRNNYLFSMPYENYVFSTGYAQMRPKINAAFLMCFLQTESFVQNVLDNCTGTSYPAINSSDLSNLKISLPILKSEQSKIGKLISNLDHLITLHQREVFYTLKHIFYRCCDTLLSGGL